MVVVREESESDEDINAFNMTDLNPSRAKENLMVKSSVVKN